MSSLNDTILQNVYNIFRVQNDSELCARMTLIGLVYTIGTGLTSIFLPVPYGRYQNKIFGPTINAKLGWMLQECMAFFCPLIIILNTEALQLRNYSNVVPLALFMFHYFHRSFIYPLVTSSQSKPTPILTVVNAVIFCSYNGFLQGQHLANVAKIQDSFHGLLGTSIFLTGMAINISHDRMLIALRKNDTKSSKDDTPKKNGIGQGEKTEKRGILYYINVFNFINLATCPIILALKSVKSQLLGETPTQSSSPTPQSPDTPRHRYKIPRGGLFEYVSGANYLGEIIEWIGLAIITREYPQIIFAMFTATFLGIRAVHHHKFYKDTFGPTYPKSRTAIIPFIL